MTSAPLTGNLFPSRVPLLDTYEAAAYLAVPRQTLAVWRCRKPNTGPAYVKVGKHVKYRLDDLDAFLAAHRVASDTPPVKSAVAA